MKAKSSENIELRYIKTEKRSFSTFVGGAHTKVFLKFTPLHTQMKFILQESKNESVTQKLQENIIRSTRSDEFL